MAIKPDWKPPAILKPNWPSQAGRDAFYGNPRGRNTSRPSPAWEKANLVSIKPPFRMTYDGRAVSSLTIHRKCAESLLRVLTAIWVAAGKKQAVVDQWGVSVYGGAYSYRLVRGGDTLSSHSWACAPIHATPPPKVSPSTLPSIF